MIGFKVQSHRETLINRFAADPLVWQGVRIDLKRHMEKQRDGTSVEVPTCAFAGWKGSKFSGQALSQLFDHLCDCCSNYICPAPVLDASQGSQEATCAPDSASR